MYKLNKIHGFVALPIIIGSAVLAVGVLGGLAYEYKNNQSILSVINKNNLLAQVSGATASITVISPNGGETFQQGQTVPISWSSANMGSLTVSIDLTNSSGAFFDAGSIASNITNAGYYNWTIPANFPNGSYKMKLSSFDRGPSVMDDGDGYFTIGAPSPAPAITSAYENISDGSIIVDGTNLTSVKRLQYTDTISNQSGELSNAKLKSVSSNQVLFYKDINMANSSSLYNIKVVDDRGNVSNVIPLDLRLPQSDLLPTINSFSPASGYQGANTKVLIYGTNLDTAIGVIFSAARGGGNYSAEFSPITEKQIEIVTPSNLPVNSYYIIVSGHSGSSVSTTNSPLFTVIPNPNPSIRVTYPNGGESFKTGDSMNISWTPQSPGVGMIELISNSGGSLRIYSEIVYGYPVNINGYWDYQIPISTSLSPGQYRVRIYGADGSQDDSDNYFMITAPVVVTPSITRFSPTSGPAGTKLQVYGTNLSGITNVTLTQRLCCTYYAGTSYPMEWSPVSNTEFGIPIPSIASGDYFISMCTSSGCTTPTVDGPVFTITASQPTCTSSTSCASQYCQYGGDLKKCTVKKTDCSTSSYTTGGCNSVPPYTSVCNSTAKAIVDSVGGCAKIDRSLYSNIYDVCCAPVVVTEKSLLSMLNTALADRFIDKQEETALLTALNSYLGQ